MSNAIETRPWWKAAGGFLRRRLSFSLRTLLLVVTAIAIWLGWQTYLAREQREAIVSLNMPKTQFEWLNLAENVSVVYDFEEAQFRRSGRFSREPPAKPHPFSEVLGLDFCHR